MKQPIDVLIPAYNMGSWVKEAIQSCLQSQVGRVVVVDDCSPDDLATWKAISECANEDPRVVGLRLAENGGQYVATNVAYQHCRPEAEFIAFHDGDDIATRDRFQKTLEAFAKMEKLDIVSGRDESLNADGTEHKPMLGRECQYQNPDWPTQILSRRYGHLVMHGAMTIRRRVMETLKGFEPSYGGSDTQFIIRAYFAGFEMRNLSAVLLRRRLHDKQATKNAPKDPTRGAYRQKQASEYIWWNMLKKQCRLTRDHLSVVPAILPIACTINVGQSPLPEGRVLRDKKGPN